jgi:HSP20 family protein
MNRLVTYDPFADAGFDDLFRGFFRPVRSATPSPVSIKMDVAENDKGYLVHAEIPGARKEDIQVTIEGNQVTIGAEVKREVDAKDGEPLLRSERYYGSVYRSFTLPVELEEADSAAKFENGVLELTLAKKAAVTGRKLTIQ